MSQEPAAQQPQLQVKISDEVLKGVYANLVQVGHSAEEFVLDFMNLFPPSGVVGARVIMSPPHLKRFLAALSENLQRFEDQYGKIAPQRGPDHPIGFRTE